MLPPIHFDPLDPTSAVEETRVVSLLGSTGSIGTQTLDIVRLFRDRIRVGALVAGSNVERLAAQAVEFRPDLVVVADRSREEELRDRLRRSGIRVEAGPEAVREAAVLPGVDTVVTALVGFAGLLPTLDAVAAGKKIAVANKETLVVAGSLVRERAERSGSVVIPVDSEHSAIFQCLVGEPKDAVERIHLTASGGPFRDRPLDTFADITREEALRHPNWSMGSKITIDSATMMNKGLEVIEARWLFDLEPDRIRVVVHRQSIIHSMVEFRDGSTKAQLGPPDMKVPIQYALSYPERWEAPHARVDWHSLGSLDFEAPDPGRFPALGLAYDALRTGGTAPAVLNAANEAAVAAFLDGRLRFVAMADVVGEATVRLGVGGHPDLVELFDADARARAFVEEHAASCAL